MNEQAAAFDAEKLLQISRKFEVVASHKAPGPAMRAQAPADILLVDIRNIEFQF